MRIQDKMKETLAKTGIPAKRIDCYGAQIMITAWSEDAARKWATLLANFATVKNVIETVEENKVKNDTRLRWPTHKVWRVWATVQA